MNVNIIIIACAGDTSFSTGLRSPRWYFQRVTAHI